MPVSIALERRRFSVADPQHNMIKMSKLNLLVRNVLGEKPYPTARHWFKTEFNVSQVEGTFYLTSRYARSDIGEPVFVLARRMLSPDTTNA